MGKELSREEVLEARVAALEAALKTQTASENDRVSKAIDRVTNKLTKEVRSYATTLKPLIKETAIASARSHADHVSQIYAEALSTLATVEMATMVLWKLPINKRPLSIENAAIRMVRLMGHGGDYFHKRADWTIADWLQHLATLKEDDMPMSTKPETTPLISKLMRARA